MIKSFNFQMSGVYINPRKVQLCLTIRAVDSICVKLISFNNHSKLGSIYVICRTRSITALYGVKDGTSYTFFLFQIVNDRHNKDIAVCLREFLIGD